MRLDRLGRSLGELLTTVAMLKERGIALLSLEERIDTNSAAGELVFHVFGAIAHFERRLIAERTKDGIAAARARGKRPGRHPLDPEKIAAALELVKAGLPPTVAARQLGLGRSTVLSRSRSRRYRAIGCLNRSMGDEGVMAAINLGARHWISAPNPTGQHCAWRRRPN